MADWPVVRALARNIWILTKHLSPASLSYHIQELHVHNILFVFQHLFIGIRSDYQAD